MKAIWLSKEKDIDYNKVNFKVDYEIKSLVELRDIF